MTKVTITIFLFFCVLSSFAQEFGTHWICHPLPNDSSEILFCHTYLTQQRPQQASLTFASTGQLRVYVNERNITPYISYDNRDSSIIAIQTYDITRYLYPDSNTIAVWYAPTARSSSTKQLHLEYYGTDAHGKAFYYAANGDWECMELKGCYKKENGEEMFDRRSYDSNWKAANCDKAYWQHPLGPPPPVKTYPISSNPYHRKNKQLARILTPVNSHTDSLGLTFYFERDFIGTIRLTLRDAHQGERIQIGSFTYICSGTLDEQAFRYFTATPSRTFVVQGDKYFKKEQIVNVEALEYE